MEKTKSYWYCPNCKEELNGCHVTYQEICEYCGTAVLSVPENISQERAEELFRAEAEGRLVVLPCKVGTRVWVIGQDCDLCHDMYTEEPCLFGDCEYRKVIESVFLPGMADEFDKTVFLTREEAEKALQSRLAYVVCHYCFGKGSLEGEGYAECPYCDGTGLEPVDDMMDDMMDDEIELLEAGE